MPVGIHERPGVVLTNDSSHVPMNGKSTDLETAQHELRHERDEREINRADSRQTSHDRHEILSRRPARTNARHETRRASAGCQPLPRR
jgi:hypothetical protein